MDEQKSEKQAEHAKSGKSDLKGGINQLEALLDEYMVKKAPFALPKGVKEFIATVSPYLTIVLALMIIPGILALVGISALITPFAMMGGYYGLGHGWGFMGIISLIFSLTDLALVLIAVPGLFKRTKGAWRLLFYASIIGLIGSIISIHGIISGIIGAIIGWYILFQMKDMYKN